MKFKPRLFHFRAETFNRKEKQAPLSSKTHRDEFVIKRRENSGSTLIRGGQNTDEIMEGAEVSEYCLRDDKQKTKLPP